MSTHVARSFTHSLSLLFSPSVLPNDAAPLAVLLHALTVNLFLFLFSHHASVSMQLNLVFPCMGNRPRVAAMQLKIDFQVKNRALPFPSLFCLSASQSNRFFSPLMNIYGEVSIWSPCRAKIRSQIKISPTTFPHCRFTSSSLLFLRGVNRESWLTHDTRLVLRTIILYLCTRYISIYNTRFPTPPQRSPLGKELQCKQWHEHVKVDDNKANNDFKMDMKMNLSVLCRFVFPILVSV